MILLRPYQTDILNATREAYRQGYKRPCIVAPCGAGKSVIVAEMARAATAKQNRVLFLVHRQELCDQIETTFREASVNMDLCHIGMVQTVTRRLAKMQTPDLIITDENHHCLANSYKRIYAHWPSVLCVGVTATPVRLNGGGLGDINDKLIIGVGTRWLIDNKYLAPFEYYAPTLADMSGVRVRAGEFDAAEVAVRLSKPSIYGDAVRHYQQLAAGQKAICYCPSIVLSKRMADEFKQAGITSAHIDGETPKQLRSEIIESFRAGHTKVLCNVDLISEGFDVPDCSCAILLRPTQSLTLFTQQSMRCMRYEPNKTAIIIDHVGNYARHGLPDTERTWELAPAKKKQKALSGIKIKQCPKCFFVHKPEPSCPQCGFVYPVASRTLAEIKEAKLQRIQGFVLNYQSPRDCTSYAELMVYAAKKGYKQGWAYYQAKARGMI
ncbi:MAG TPA: DEAD/DEAH box helicase [Anaerolineaceae bacterium]|nr:DEAD/DEAH box helicase [Anaerolineaceae bacterium]